MNPYQIRRKETDKGKEGFYCRAEGEAKEGGRQSSRLANEVYRFPSRSPCVAFAGGGKKEMNDFLSLPARTAFAIGGYPPLICSAEGAGGPESGAATRCRRGGRATLISFLHPLKGSSRKINIFVR